MNGVLLIMFVLACTIRVDGRKLYEFLAVTKVDGLPPAPSFMTLGRLKIMFAKFDNSLELQYFPMD